MYYKENLNPDIIASDIVLYVFFNVHFKMKHSGKYSLPCFLKLFYLGNLAEDLGPVE